jgi:hypothetical protein
MSKYGPLRIYLQNSNNVTEILTFQQVEKILGFLLPESASIHRAWWANDLTHTHSKEWLNAGWKVESVSVGFKVTFSKIN